MVGAVIDGVTPGVPLTEADFAQDLTRRRNGENHVADEVSCAGNRAPHAVDEVSRNIGGNYAPSATRALGVTMRRERDRVEIVSGVFNGLTTGVPVALIIRNEDTQSSDYEQFASHPRPSHADFAAAAKYHGFNDPRGGGQFSGRMTAPLVAAGVIAKKMLATALKSAPQTTLEANPQPPATSQPNKNDEQHAFEIAARIVETGDVAAAQATGDSVGGIVECVAKGLPAGLGEPFFDTVESVIAHLLFAIPAVKGVEFGAGFSAARMLGSEHNDLIINAQGTTATNHAGGICGGLTNSNPLIVRVAIKPTASIAREQLTFSRAVNARVPLKIGGRHDVCIALRAPVVVEAAVAIALAQFI